MVIFTVVLFSRISRVRPCENFHFNLCLFIKLLIVNKSKGLKPIPLKFYTCSWIVNICVGTKTSHHLEFSLSWSWPKCIKSIDLMHWRHRAAMLGVKAIALYALLRQLAHFWQLLLRIILLTPKRRHSSVSSMAWRHISAPLVSKPTLVNMLQNLGPVSKRELTISCKIS